MRLKNKIAIITGASNGIGEAEARLFAKEGATVLLTDVDVFSGKNVAEQIRNNNGLAEFRKADASSKTDWEDLFEYALKRFGRLDILVNNAGISSSSFSPENLDAWDELININAKSAYLGTQLASEIMKNSGGGSIINTSSIFGIAGGVTGHPAYHASKAAVRNLTKAMAVRMAPHSVRINSVHPGYMTPMVSSKVTGAVANAERAAKSPMGRLGKPIDVAYGVLYLASDEASYVTGTELVIDGGFLSQ